MTTANRSDGDATVTIGEAASRLGVHYMTAYKYVRTGRLEAQKSGSRWMVSISSVETMLAGAAHAPHGEIEQHGASREVHRDRLIHALVAGDEPAAWATIESAMESGATPDEIDLDLIVPAMHSIGDGWARGELSVADEHRASAVVHRLLGILGAQLRRRGARRGRVVVATVAGDDHALATAVLRGMWARHGFDLIDLGANTPAESIVETTRAVDALAVGLSATTPGNEAHIAATLRRLADTLPGVPRLLGGQAIADVDHALQLGADHYGDTGRETVELLREIAR